MSGSITPGPSAGDGRGDAVARFWLLMALYGVWTSGNLGMPGRKRHLIRSTKCEKCSEPALRQLDGSYKCPNGHIFRKGEGKNQKRK